MWTEEGLVRRCHAIERFAGGFCRQTSQRRNHPLYLTGPNFILRNAAGLAGTGFNDGRRSTLQLPGAPCRYEDVPVVTVEAIH